MVKLCTASPSILIAVSFQCPNRTFLLIYSSARLTPPVNATFPSITQIFRCSRLFWLVERMGTIGPNSLHWIPYSRSCFGYSYGKRLILQVPSYIRRTSTPSFTFLRRTSRTVSHTYPSPIIKYSMKINFSALFSSSIRTGNLSSPSGKYCACEFP